MEIKAIYFFILALFILISPDPFSMAYAGLLFLLVMKLMWRSNEPKHLFIGLLMYWFVVALLLPYGAFFKIPLSDLSEYGKSNTLVLANFLALTSLLFFMIGIYLPLKNIFILNLKSVESYLVRYDGKKLFIVYVIFSVSSNFFLKYMLSASAGQLLIALVNFKWVLLTFLITHTLLFSANQKYVIILVAVEFFLSFSGFWSNFKDYLIVALGSFLMLNRTIKIKNFIFIFISVLIGYFFLVFWSFSKGEYRRYLTGGERSQVVLKNDTFENLGVLFKIFQRDFLSDNFAENFADGSQRLLYRISYIDYFSLTLSRVPTFMPHENGKLTQEAFQHIFKPRLFFPDKKIIDDSEITSKYTGKSFSGINEGASFSLGLVPECYIDFGLYLMFIPVFIYGIWIGLMYKFFLVKGYNIIWGLCYTAPMYNFLTCYGIPSTKFLGWSLTYFFGIWFINKYLVAFLDRWMLKKNNFSL
jgi:hypothetical protein